MTSSAAMSSAVASVVSMEVEGVMFSPTVTPQTSSKELILAGAGVRGLMIEGKFVKFTVISVYIEEAIVPHLLLKWKDKTAEELSNTLDFYMDLVTCPYEKVARVAFVSPLTGVEFCRKVSENCRIACEAAGIYSEAEAKAIEQLKDVFSLFISEEVDKVELLYTKFVSLIKFEPVIHTLLPPSPKGEVCDINGVCVDAAEDEMFRLTTKEGRLTVEREMVRTPTPDFSPALLFEKDPVQILDALLPLYLNSQILRALQESYFGGYWLK